MRAAQIVAPKRIEIVEVDKPEPTDGQALVRITHAGLCGSDWPIYDGQAAEYPQPPGAPAHEVMGVIENPGASDLKPGQRVLVVTRFGLAEYVAANPDDLLPLPDDIPSERILVCQPLGTVIRALRKLPTPLGWRAVVIGAGPIGLLFTMMLERGGCRQIVAVDPLPDRLDRARKLGATSTVQATAAEALDDGLAETADLVVEAVGIPETIAVAPAMARRSGITLMFGVPRNLPPNGRVGFDVRDLLYREARIIYSHGPDLERDIGLARDLIAAGRVDVSPVVSHVMPFDQVAEAYQMAYERRPGTAKIVLAIQ